MQLHSCYAGQLSLTTRGQRLVTGSSVGIDLYADET